MTIFEILAIISPVASVTFAYIAFRRNQKTDDSASAREMGQLLTEVGYIKSQLDSLTRKNENSDARYTQLSERVTVVEQSANSAHKRIDNLINKDGGR